MIEGLHAGADGGYPTGGARDAGHQAISDSTQAHDSSVPPRSRAPGTPAALCTRYEHFEVLWREDGSPWKLGCGAMGETYKAMDTRLHCVVALKVIRPDLLDRTAAVRERFLREARAAASVHHPNIARVYHLGELSDGQAFYAMEFVEGDTLAERVQRWGPLPVLVALEIALQITRALGAAAAVDLIHRDIKPANIMLTLAGMEICSSGAELRGANSGDINGEAHCPPLVKVIDFGLARTIKRCEGMALTAHGDFVGTPQYASPEQFGEDSTVIDSRSDIFSLGISLWFLLTGKPPYCGRSLDEIQRMKERPPPFKQLRAASIPEPVIRLLRAMLALEPDKRPQAPAMLTELLGHCRREVLSMTQPTVGKGPFAGRQSSAGRRKSKRHSLHGWTTFVLVAAVILSIAFWAIRTEQRGPVKAAVDAHPTSTDDQQWRVSSQILDQSVAVLPFANLSDDRGNAYFTEGIQDSILTRLSKVASLKVISRTSTQQYASKPANVPEIARQLGVAYILEGSVQKAGGMVRVNVQLIQAASDTHVWAEIYDRSVDNLFGVESEVSQAVANQLHLKLSRREQDTIARQPTANAQAYEHYLRGLSYSLRSNADGDDGANAIKSLQESVRLDPDFALAWACLGRAAAFTFYRQFYDDKTGLPKIADEAVQRALSLQPDLGEAILAQGYFFYYCERDYARAESSFEQARTILPNSSQVLEAHALVSRRTGHWKQALADFEQAVRLDPRDPNLLFNQANTYCALRLFPAALRSLDQMLDIYPRNEDALCRKADVDQARGDLPAAAASLAQMHVSPYSNPFGMQMTQWLCERRYDLAIAALKGALEHPDPALPPESKTDFQSYLAWFQEYAGNRAEAQKYWREVRSELEPLYRADTRNYARFEWLALARASLGDKTGAIAIANDLAKNFVGRDPLIEPGLREFHARILVRIGELDQAASILDALLTCPYVGVFTSAHPVTRASLRLDPEWEPLRKQGRFAKLFSDPEPSTAFD